MEGVLSEAASAALASAEAPPDGEGREPLGAGPAVETPSAASLEATLAGMTAAPAPAGSFQGGKGFDAAPCALGDGGTLENGAARPGPPVANMDVGAPEPEPATRAQPSEEVAIKAHGFVERTIGRCGKTGTRHSRASR